MQTKMTVFFCGLLTVASALATEQTSTQQTPIDVRTVLVGVGIIANTTSQRLTAESHLLKGNIALQEQRAQNKLLKQYLKGNQRRVEKKNKSKNGYHQFQDK